MRETAQAPLPRRRYAEGDIGAIQDAVDAVQDDVSSIKEALFGNPLDHDDLGVVGALRDIRDGMIKVASDKHASMERLYIGLLSFLGVLMIVAATVFAALR